MYDPIRITAENEWVFQALCAQTDPEQFFPEHGGSNREAKRVCATCDVQAECLEYALRHREPHGVWGGLTEKERQRLLNGAHRHTPQPTQPVAAHETAHETESAA